MVRTARHLREAAVAAALTVLGVVAFAGLLVVSGAVCHIPAAAEQRRQSFGHGDSFRGVAVVMAIGDAFIAVAAVGLVLVAMALPGRRRTIVRTFAAAIVAFGALAFISLMALESVL